MPLTSVSMRNSTWMDGVQVAAQDLRLQQASAFLTGASPSGSTGIAARPGVRYGTGDPLKISASSGMTLAVNAGVAFVQGSAAANAGMYTGILDVANTVTLATSDPTNPRIDNIIVQFTDVGTSSSTGVVTPQTGTPAASPVAPTLPANSLLLAQVAVAASTSSIVAGNITDKRVWTAALGGITPMANVTGGISGMAGLYAHDLSTGRLKVSDGAGNAQAPKVSAFAPVSAMLGANSANINPGFSLSILSVSITTDGSTEIRIEVNCCAGVNQSTFHAGDWGEHQIWVDSTQIPGGSFYFQQPSNAASGFTTAFAAGNGTFIGYATPSAGTHTVAWLVQNAAGSINSCYVAYGGAAFLKSSLRVSAVPG